MLCENCKKPIDIEKYYKNQIIENKIKICKLTNQIKKLSVEQWCAKKAIKANLSYITDDVKPYIQSDIEARKCEIRYRINKIKQVKRTNSEMRKNIKRYK